MNDKRITLPGKYIRGKYLLRFCAFCISSKQDNDEKTLNKAFSYKKKANYAHPSLEEWIGLEMHLSDLKRSDRNFLVLLSVLTLNETNRNGVENGISSMLDYICKTSLM